MWISANFHLVNYGIGTLDLFSLPVLYWHSERAIPEHTSTVPWNGLFANLILSQKCWTQPGLRPVPFLIDRWWRSARHHQSSAENLYASRGNLFNFNRSHKAVLAGHHCFTSAQLALAWLYIKPSPPFSKGRLNPPLTQSIEMAGLLVHPVTHTLTSAATYGLVKLNCRPLLNFDRFQGCCLWPLTHSEPLSGHLWTVDHVGGVATFLT
jgi:hypothetical protein